MRTNRDTALLRDSLLAQEPVNENRQKQFEREVTQMFEQKLTMSSRSYWIASLIGSALFVVGVMPSIISHQTDPIARSIRVATAVLIIGAGIFGGYVLRRGKLDIRWQFVWSKIVVALSLVIVLLTLVNAANTPTIPSLVWALFGLVWFILAISMTVFNRVIQAELAQREQLLKIQFKLEDLLERFPPEDESGAMVPR
jgi:hypothetical protein